MLSGEVEKRKVRLIKKKCNPHLQGRGSFKLGLSLGHLIWLNRWNIGSDGRYAWENRFLVRVEYPHDMMGEKCFLCLLEQIESRSPSSIFDESLIPQVAKNAVLYLCLEKFPNIPLWSHSFGTLVDTWTWRRTIIHILPQSSVAFVSSVETSFKSHGCCIEFSASYRCKMWLSLQGIQFIRTTLDLLRVPSCLQTVSDCYVIVPNAGSVR